MPTISDPSRLGSVGLADRHAGPAADQLLSPVHPLDALAKAVRGLVEADDDPAVAGHRRFARLTFRPSTPRSTIPVDSSQRKARATAHLSQARPTTTFPSPLARQKALLRNRSQGWAPDAMGPARARWCPRPEGGVLEADRNPARSPRWSCRRGSAATVWCRRCP